MRFPIWVCQQNGCGSFCNCNIGFIFPKCLPHLPSDLQVRIEDSKIMNIGAINCFTFSSCGDVSTVHYAWQLSAIFHFVCVLGCLFFGLAIFLVHCIINQLSFRSASLLVAKL